MSLVVPPLALALVIGLAIAGGDHGAGPVVADAMPSSVVPAPSGAVAIVQAADVPLPTPVRVLINGEHRNRFTVGEPMTAWITPTLHETARPSFRQGASSNFRVDPYAR